MMSKSCKLLIRTHEKTLEWLKANNENGHHDKSITLREKEIIRLKNNPF